MKRLLAYAIAAALLLAVVGPSEAFNFPWDGGHRSGGTGRPPVPTPGGSSDSGGRGRGGDDVDFASGDFSYSVTDIRIAARGPDLNLGRTYHTQEEYIGPFGRGWHCNWDVKVVATLDGDQEQMTLFNLGGQLGVRKVFEKSGGGEWVAPPGYHADLTVNPDDTVTVTTKHGTVYRFASLTAAGLSPPAGLLTSVTDRNGNQATVTYDGSGRLAAVADASGRTLTFTYGGSGHVVTVTDPAGRELGYQYDTYHRLVRYTNALGHSEIYVYDTANRLISVSDAKGVTWLRTTATIV